MSPDHPEVTALHHRIDQLARLEPTAVFALSLLAFRVLEAAKQRTMEASRSLDRVSKGGA